MTPASLDVRNRRTATRIVGAVLVFHSLALGAGVWVLRAATQADSAMARAAMPPVRTPAASVVAAPSDLAGAVQLRAELPDWVLKAGASDAAAPWRVDARGHVVLNTAH
jgi:hypothetical protein